MKQAHCQYCGRWLAQIDDNGNLAIVGEASIQFDFNIPKRYQMPKVMISSTEGIPQFETARCLRWMCRFERWIGR